MKKLLPAFFMVAIAFSCSDSELASPDVHDITATFPSEFLVVAKIDKILRYRKGDPGYEEKTQKIRQEATQANEWEGNSDVRSDRVPVEDDGTYYEITGNGKRTEMLETTTFRYFSKVYAAPNVAQISNVTFTPVYSANGPRFTYSARATNGSILGNTIQAQPQLTWWGCVQNQFYEMCMSSPFRALMCGAAGGAAPELMLVVYGSWMIGCAW